MREVDRRNWLGWQVQAQTYQALSQELKLLVESTDRGYNRPPVGLAEIPEHDFWHSLSQNVPAVIFNVWVTRDEEGEKLPPEEQLSLTCYVYPAGHGVAFAYKPQTKALRTFRIGCQHKWTEIKQSWEVINGRHVYYCQHCKHETEVWST